MSDALDTSTPEITALEMDISETQQSLDDKLEEIGRRLQPAEVKAEFKDAMKRRLDPEAYIGYIASGLIAFGTLMAVRGWRRSRHPVPSFGACDYPMTDPGL